jgi:hypothetical protein
MPWYPLCKTEYREGFTTCSDCESALVEELDNDPSPPEKAVYDDWKLLATFADEQEADMIESFLNAENINTWKTYPGFSNLSKIVGGMTKLGVNIYVKETDYYNARIIAEDILQKPIELQNSANEPVLEKPAEPERSESSPFFRLLLIGAIILFLYSFFPSLFAPLKNLFNP